MLTVEMSRNSCRFIVKYGQILQFVTVVAGLPSYIEQDQNKSCSEKHTVFSNNVSMIIT